MSWKIPWISVSAPQTKNKADLEEEKILKENDKD